MSKQVCGNPRRQLHRSLSFSFITELCYFTRLARLKKSILGLCNLSGLESEGKQYHKSSILDQRFGCMNDEVAWILRGCVCCYLSIRYSPQLDPLEMYATTHLPMLLSPSNPWTKTPQFFSRRQNACCFSPNFETPF